MSNEANTRLDASTLSAEVKAQIATEFVAELTQVCKGEIDCVGIGGCLLHKMF